MDELTDTGLVNWRELPPAQRRVWWEQLWLGVIALAERYRLALRAGWWEDSIQVEALAAFCAWLALYDTGAYVDPAGKLQLLWELDRLRVVIRGGEHAFDPARHRPAYEHHLAQVGCPNDADDAILDAPDGPVLAQRIPRDRELTAVTERLAELSQREQILSSELDHDRARDQSAAQPQRELTELRRTIEQFAYRRRELDGQFDETGRG